MEEKKFLVALHNTQWCIHTVGRNSLDEGPARRRHLYLTTRNTHNRHPRPRRDSNPQSQQASGRRPTPWPRGHLVRLKTFMTVIIYRPTSFDTPGSCKTKLKGIFYKWHRVVCQQNEQVQSVSVSTQISLLAKKCVCLFWRSRDRASW